MPHFRMKLTIALAIIALSTLSLGCIRIQPHSHFLPQTTLGGWKVSGGTLARTGTVPVDAVTNCSTLMAAYLVAYGDDDPYERDADLSVTQNGDGCSTVIGEPTPQ